MPAPSRARKPSRAPPLPCGFGGAGPGQVLRGEGPRVAAAWMAARTCPTHLRPPARDPDWGWGWAGIAAPEVGRNWLLGATPVGRAVTRVGDTGKGLGRVGPDDASRAQPRPGAQGTAGRCRLTF